MENELSPKLRKLNKDCLSPLRIGITNDERKTIVKLLSILIAKDPKNIFQNKYNKYISSLYCLGLEDKKIEEKALLLFASLGDGERLDLSRDIFNIHIFRFKKPVVPFTNSIISIFYHVYYLPLSPFLLAKISYNDNGLNNSIVDSNDITWFYELIVSSPNINIICASNKNVLEDIKSLYFNASGA